MNSNESKPKGIRLNRAKKAIFFLAAILMGNSATAQTWYGLFPSSEASDNVRLMRTKDESNVIHWKMDNSITTKTQINLKSSDSRLNKYNQAIPELSNQLQIPCLTPGRDFKLRGATAFKDMGLSLCDTIGQLDIWLTFKPSGAPDTLFVGRRPSRRHIFDFPTPKIIFHSNKTDKWGVFVKGAALSFEAEAPEGINDELLEWEWYEDGEQMTGRNDRWFETYSRTNWKNGPHTISCRYRKKDGQRYSAIGSVEIQQMTTDAHSIKVYPYWGADCTDEENQDSTNLHYNETSKWGSFELQPMQEYVHFYMEILNTNLTTQTITNDGSIQNFELLKNDDSGEEYKFFNLPTTGKAHAKEPYSTATIYFKIDGENINYSLRPYVTPKVSITPDSVDICENSFEAASEMSIFTASSQGLPQGTESYQWYYSHTKNGHYSAVTDVLKSEKYIPDHTGYYKVKVTDGVFSSMSAPVKVRQRTDNCISANIYSKDGKNYTCPNGSAEMHTSLIGPAYSYQWKIGDEEGNHLKNIDDANSDLFYGAPNRPGEAYFVEVTYGSRKVISQPYRIRELSPLKSLNQIKLLSEAMQKEVCMDYDVTLKARLSVKKDDSLPLIYNFYQSSIINPILIGSVESADQNVYWSTPVHQTGSNYFVVAVGCDRQLRSADNMTVNLRSDDNCGSGNFYVKKSGNDFKDGTNWDNAFGTMSHALRYINHLRKSVLYRNTPIQIHIAAGIYTPEEKEGYDLPDNVTLYGGYEELPTDNSMSGTVRNPRTPANPKGQATIFMTDSANWRIATLTDKENIKFVGINFMGEEITTNLDGRGLYINGSSVTLDSCWVTGFKSSQITDKPVTAVALVKDENSTSHLINPQLTIQRTTFTDNIGGEWGCCLDVQCDGNLLIEQSTFNHNTNAYRGGTALLSYNSSPKINIRNSTFYDNRIKEGADGMFGNSVMRMVGGEPTVNIINSTICDHFYKEAGTLNIYHSIVENAGKADVYSNNFPKESSFDEADKDKPYNERVFAANFKGPGYNKMQNVQNCITQMLIPSNKLEIVNQAGEPHIMCLRDQRGIRRNDIASTYGAYDVDYSVAIEQTTAAECYNQKTVTSLKSAVAGLDSIKYQWVDNYSDIEGANTSNLKDISLGTYWLEVTGKSASGKTVSLRSNEIRVSDICENPGEFFVKDREGSDAFSGTTWSQAFATLDKALQQAQDFRQKNPGAKVTIHLAAGTYRPVSLGGFKLEKYANDLTHIKIIGGYSYDPAKDEVIQPKSNEHSKGNETILTPLNNKGRLFEFSSKIKGLKMKGLHFKGAPKMQVSGGALLMSGGEVELDSCWISDFTDGTTSGLNTTLVLNETSKLTLKDCNISDNKAKRGSGIVISGEGNTTQMDLYNCTFNNNSSELTGGAALRITNKANPTIKAMNCTFFSNRCTDAGHVGVTTIRLEGVGCDLKMYNCTLYGTMYPEFGKVEIYNSLIEATGNNVTAVNSYIADSNLKGITDEISKERHRKFADAFKYIMSSDCGFVPVLRLKPMSNDEMDTKQPTLENKDQFDMSKDACNKSRKAISNMGACEIKE